MNKPKLKKPDMPLRLNQRGKGNKYLSNVILDAGGGGLLPSEQDWVAHAANHYEELEARIESLESVLRRIVEVDDHGGEWRSMLVRASDIADARKLLKATPAASEEKS